MSNNESNFIAHDNQKHSEHLENIALICHMNADKICYGAQGELLGMLHDVRKYSNQYQNFMKSNTRVKMGKSVRHEDHK